MELGKSKEDYLKTVLILQRKMGNVHSVNVAEYMNVSKASVSVAMKNLRNNGFLNIADNGTLQLSSKGYLVATQIYERYDFL